MTAADFRAEGEKGRRRGPVLSRGARRRAGENERGPTGMIARVCKIRGGPHRGGCLVCFPYPEAAITLSRPGGSGVPTADINGSAAISTFPCLFDDQIGAQPN
jgi:hypothetical protein